MVLNEFRLKAAGAINFLSNLIRTLCVSGGSWESLFPPFLKSQMKLLEMSSEGQGGNCNKGTH